MNAVLLAEVLSSSTEACDRNQKLEYFGGCGDCDRIGTLSAMQATIHTLPVRGYAEPNDWSQPISTGRPHEVMSIKRGRIGREFRLEIEQL